TLTHNMPSPHLDPYLHGVKKQNNKTTPATFKRGVIVTVHPSAWSADVIVVGNNQTILKNIPLSSAITPSQVRAGDRCRIDMFDETNQNDMIIAYTYGRAPSQVVNSGLFAVPGSDLSHHAIPHGLSVTPTLISVSTWPSGVPSGGGEPGFVWVSQTLPVADATNIYVDSAGGSKTIYWAAAIL
ncbi:MAG: hypothetical protein ACRDF4_11575, partial [Rhabdochlamydiaceae bacterium]